MNRIDFFLWFIMILSAFGTIYMVTSLAIKKNKLKKQEINKIANSKYIVIIVIIIILFVIYGLMRNFK